MPALPASARRAAPHYGQARAPIDRRVRDLLPGTTLKDVAQLQANTGLPVIVAMPLPAIDLDKGGTVDDAIARRRDRP